MAANPLPNRSHQKVLTRKCKPSYYICGINNIEKDNFQIVILDLGSPQRVLEIPLSRRFFTQITPRKCLKFMITQSLLNHAGCQIDHSRNNAILSSNSRFHAPKNCRTTPSCFPLWKPPLIYIIFVQ